MTCRYKTAYNKRLYMAVSGGLRYCGSIFTKEKVPYFGTEGGAGEKELSKFRPHGETHF